MPYSKLIIFIRYEDNSYYFMYHIQGNIIFCSTHTIFDKKFFPKYTKSCVKEYKLYDKLLNKISSKIELSVSRPFSKDKPALVSISPIQNNSPPCFLSLSPSYKSLSLLLLSVPKNPMCHKLHSACIYTTSRPIFTN